MKTATLFLAGALLSLPALADHHGLQEDRMASQLCQAALESKAAVAAKAKELGVTRKQLKMVSCTLAPAATCAQRTRSARQECAGMSLAEFARAHKHAFNPNQAIVNIQ